MTDSFYYFFSTVPQVLAAILVLFGVLVVFKIHGLNSDLLGIATDIIDAAEKLEVSPPHLDQSIFDGTIGVTTEMITELNSYYKRKNTKGLKSVVDKMLSIQYAFNDSTDLLIKSYADAYNFLQTLIKRTINFSVLSAIILILCIGILPLGEVILKHAAILDFLFVLIIAGIIICLYFLIKILTTSLKEHVSDNSHQ